MLGERSGIEIALPDRDRATRRDEIADIIGLVIVHRVRIGHENRRPARTGQFGDGRRPRPRDDEMRPAQPLGKVGDIGRALGRDPERGIFGAHRFDVGLAALLDDLQPVEQRARQHGDGGGNDVAQHRRTQAAADNEQANDAVLGQRRIAVLADRDNFLAHRIADQVALVGTGGRETADMMVGDRNRIDPSRHQPVGAAQHGILFVDDAGRLGRARGEQAGQRRIAAEADNHRRVEIADQVDRHRAPLADRQRRLHPADGAALNAAGGQYMRFQLGRRARNPEAAVVADQRDAVPARDQFAGERIGGEHMTAGASGGEKIVARRGHGRAVISCSSCGSSIPAPHRGFAGSATRANPCRSTRR